MNARLHDLIVEAEAKLGPEAQERLAEIVESFVVSWTHGTGVHARGDGRGCARSTPSRSRRPIRPRSRRCSGGVADLAFSPRALASLRERRSLPDYQRRNLWTKRPSVVRFDMLDLSEAWHPGSFTKNFGWGAEGKGLRQLHRALQVGFTEDGDVPRAEFRKQAGKKSYKPLHSNELFPFHRTKGRW